MKDSLVEFSAKAVMGRLTNDKHGAERAVGRATKSGENTPGRHCFVVPRLRDDEAIRNVPVGGYLTLHY